MNVIKLIAEKSVVVVVCILAFSMIVFTSCQYKAVEYIGVNNKPVEVKTKLSNLHTKTLNNNIFTSDDLKNYDLTIVNIWKTGCEHCVDIMPSTQQFYKKLPENVNMISVCADGDDNTKLAYKIVTEANITYPALIPDDKLTHTVLGSVEEYPATLFVDNDGNVVGTIMEDFPASDYTNTYLEELDKRLEMVN